jgi:hypothetical protein
VLSIGGQDSFESQKKISKRKKPTERQTFTFERCKESELKVADLVTEDFALSLENTDAAKNEVILSIEANYEIIERKPEN